MFSEISKYISLHFTPCQLLNTLLCHVYIQSTSSMSDSMFCSTTLNKESPSINRVIWLQLQTTQLSKALAIHKYPVLRYYMAGTFSNLLEGLKPVMVMVIIQIAFGGINIFYKLATNDGMSVKIMVAYRMMFAAASMVPLALILEW